MEQKDSKVQVSAVIFPLLWNLLMDDLLNKITEAGLQDMGYGDDLMTVARGRFLEPLTNMLQETRKHAVEWLGLIGPAINPCKVEVMVSTKNLVESLL